MLQTETTAAISTDTLMTRFDSMAADIRRDFGRRQSEDRGRGHGQFHQRMDEEIRYLYLHGDGRVTGRHHLRSAPQCEDQRFDHEVNGGTGSVIVGIPGTEETHAAARAMIIP